MIILTPRVQEVSDIHNKKYRGGAEVLWLVDMRVCMTEITLYLMGITDIDINVYVAIGSFFLRIVKIMKTGWFKIFLQICGCFTYHLEFYSFSFVTLGRTVQKEAVSVLQITLHLLMQYSLHVIAIMHWYVIFLPRFLCISISCVY